MNWRILAIPISIVPFVILFVTTNVSPQDVFAVGLVPFVASAAAAVARVMLQAYRFKYFVRKFIGHDISSTGKTMSARLAGEFVTSTTPSYVGGEFVRIAWMSKQGVPIGKAAWIATMEIIADVFAVTILGFIAGAVAIYNGGTIIGITVILISLPTFGFWLFLVLYSAKRNMQIPQFIRKLMVRFLKQEKADHFSSQANKALADLCTMSRENFGSQKMLKPFIVGLGITFLSFLAFGISFLVLAGTVDSRIGLFDSLLAVSASNVVANLPITIGGSGLAELGIWAYISNLSSIPDFSAIAQDSKLNVIIAWRIASYHVPLVIFWIALMRLAIGKTPGMVDANTEGKQDKA
ncbi:MAG: hypothetical protein DA330_01510 [Nitrososphaera sp.]|nr:hypothetical protein [Nitrososphaera sp.]